MNVKEDHPTDADETVLNLFTDTSDFLNEGVAIINSAGKIILWNRAIRAMTDTGPGDITGKYIWDIVKKIFFSTGPPEDFSLKSQNFVMNLLGSGYSNSRKMLHIPVKAASGESKLLTCNIFIRTGNDEPFLYCIVNEVLENIRGNPAVIIDDISDDKSVSSMPVIPCSINCSNDDALRISAEKYSRSFHLAPISLTITTLVDGHIVEVNDEFLRNTGYCRNELSGKTVFDINIWETPEARELVISPLRTGSAVKNREIVFRHKNGDLHNYIFSAEPVKIGNIDCIISNFFNITERKKLEEALRISEEKFSRTFRLAPISLSITSLDDGIIMEVNDEFLRNTGYTRADIIGKTVFDIRIWEPPEAREGIIPHLKDGRTVKNIEIVFRHKNGDLHSYIYSAEPISLNGICCIISIFFDITGTRMLEDALRISEEMYKAVFECTGSAMGIVRNDLLVLVNNGMVNLSGFPKSEIEGKMTWQEFVIPEYVKEIRKNSQALGADEASLINKSEFKLRDINGMVKDVYCLTALGPAPSQYVVTLIDMTEYNYLLGQINDISKREQQRVGEMLHDNLIQYLTGISLLIRTLEIKMQVGRSIELKDVKKIHSLITDSLDLTKKLLKGLFLVEIDYEGLPSTLKNLAASVNEIYDISCTFADEDCEAPEIDVMKATELYYIANEAVHNAVKHGNAGEIVISLKQIDSRIILEVRDNGSGFGDNDTRNYTGIGLKLMRFRAKMIGAKIRIGNNPGGRGAGVICTLQRH